MNLAKTYRDVLSFESDMTKIPPNYGRREPNAMIERMPSPEYAALFDAKNKVVPLFDYLYFELRRVTTPAVHAFIEPFGKCFDRERAHVGTELNKIGAMWGTTPELLLKTAREAIEADICASEREFESVLATCENSYREAKLSDKHIFGGPLRESQGPHVLLMRVMYAHKIQVKEIAEMKAQLAAAQATVIDLEVLKAKTDLLSTVHSFLGKRHRSLGLRFG